KKERDLAVTKCIKKLPIGEPAIRADLKIACSNSPQVHSCVGVFIGSVKPGRGRQMEGAFPFSQFSRAGCLLHKSGPGWTGQQCGCRSSANQAQELPACHPIRLRTTAARAITLSGHRLHLLAMNMLMES